MRQRDKEPQVIRVAELRLNPGLSGVTPGFVPTQILISMKLGDNLSTGRRKGKRIKEMQMNLDAPKEALISVP